MPFSLFHYNPNQEPPFTLFIEHQDKTRDGHWRPAAFVMLTKSLCTSGFLFALPPEDLKSFLLLLTFVTPNGHCAPGLPQLAAALRVSEAKARARLERLTAARWHGQPIVLHCVAESGLQTFAIAPGLLPVREEGMPTPQPAGVYRAAPRQAVIEHSRRTYGRPRAEVERQIADRMGWQMPEPALPLASPSGKPQFSIPESSSQAQLRQELLQVGLLPEQVDELLSRFDALRIRRQLMWLPYRVVRNRAGFLIAAIKDDYAAPPGLLQPSVNPPPHQPSAPLDVASPPEGEPNSPAVTPDEL